MSTPRTDLPELFQKAVAAKAALVEALRDNKIPFAHSSYSFEAGSDRVEFVDLFGDRKDLIVIHNMGRSCRYCTLWADGLNGMLPHLESRTAVVLMNSDPVDIQKEFAETRGWTFRILRDTDGTFTEDMGYASTEDGARSLMPGFTTFHRAEDGTITRVASDFFGPGDVYMPVFHMFDLLKDGQAGWQPQYTYTKPLTITLP